MISVDCNPANIPSKCCFAFCGWLLLMIVNGGGGHSKKVIARHKGNFAVTPWSSCNFGAIECNLVGKKESGDKRRVIGQ